MKKLLSLLLLFVFVITASSCATSKKENVQATNNFEFYNGIWASDKDELLGATSVYFYEFDNESGKSWFWNDSDGGKSYEKADTIILTYTDGELFLLNQSGEKTQLLKIIDDNTLAMCSANNNYDVEGSLYLHRIDSADNYIQSLTSEADVAQSDTIGIWYYHDNGGMYTYFQITDTGFIYGPMSSSKDSTHVSLDELKGKKLLDAYSFDGYDKQEDAVIISSKLLTSTNKMPILFKFTKDTNGDILMNVSGFPAEYGTFSKVN